MTGPCKMACGREKITEEDLPQTFTVKLLGRKEARGLWGIKNTRDPVDILIAVAKDRNLSLPVIQLTVMKEGVKLTPIRAAKEKSPSLSPDELTIRCTDQNANVITEKVVTPKTHTNIFSSFKLFGLRNKSSQKNCALNKSINNTKSKDKKNEKPQYVQDADKMKFKTNFSLLEKLKDDNQRWKDRTFLGIDTISYGVQDLVFTRVFSMIVVSDEPGRSPFQCYAFVCEDRHVARCITYSLAAAFQIYSRSIKASRPIAQLGKGTVRKPKILAIDLRTAEDRRTEKTQVPFSEA